MLIPARSKAKNGKAKAGKPPARVLLLEDDALLAMALEDAFLRAGTREVIICPSMKAAMRELERKERTDAVVIDVHLADRDDGWAIAELVTLLGTKPPLFAFSTGSPEEIPQEIAAKGLVFEKPYDPDELVRQLSSGKARGLFSRLKR